MTSTTPDPPFSADARSEQGAGLAALTLAVIGFSWGYIIVKSIGLPAATLSFWRLAIGATFLGAVAVVLRVPWPRQWRPLFGAGLAFGGHQLAFIGATQRTSVAIVTLAGATQPLIVALVSRRVLGERVSATLIVSSLLAVVGVGSVVQANVDHVSRSWQGDALAGINVLLFTAYFLFAKRARTGGSPTLTFTAAFLAIALLLVAPAMMLTEPVLPGTRDASLVALLALGPGNGHLLLNWAHPRVSATLSSLVLALVPVMSSIWAHLIFDEPLGWRQLLGMLLVAIAVEAGRRSQMGR